MKYKEGYNKINKLYSEGKSFEFIKKELNVSFTKIKNALNFHNTPTRSKGVKKLSIDEFYFEEINTEDKAYFLGLLFADGCNTGKGFYITLQERDGDIIQLLKEKLKFSGELRKIEKKKSHYQNYISLCLHSPNISKCLTNLGCVKNKTVYGKFPSIPKHLMHHFIRGYFDGDGSISIDKRNQLSFSIVGHTDIILKIKTIIEEECNINLHFKSPERYKCDISIIASGGNKKIKEIFYFLYKDANIFIKRKHNKFLNIYERDKK